MKHCFWVIIAFLVTACAELPNFGRKNNSFSPSQSAPKNETLKITTLDVGQGSSVIVSSLGESALIDGGPVMSGQNIILPFLKENGINELKYIFATHYHADHIGGIAEILKGDDGIIGTADDLTPTEAVIDRGAPRGLSPEGTVPFLTQGLLTQGSQTQGGDYDDEKSGVYEEYSEAVMHKRRAALAGEYYSVGKARLEAVAANGEFADGTAITIEPYDENSASIALLITYGDFSYLYASDITGGGGTPPYNTIDMETKLGAIAGDVDVLAVSHHGSQTSTNENFLEEIKPEAAIISVGDDNDYGHPHDEVIERLLDDGVEIYQTERGWLDEDFMAIEAIHIADGPIEITVTDDNWFIK